MSSVLRYTSQNSRSGNLLLAVTTVATVSKFFTEDDFASGPLLAAGSTVAGTNLTFTTEATAATALTTGGFAVVVGQLFKDMGKNYYVYAPSASGGVPLLYAVYTKVRRIGAVASNAGFEGDNGLMGYICTSSSAQTNATGAVSGTEPICVVARVGSGHGM